MEKSITPEKRDGNLLRILRPLFWWLLLVLVLFGLRENQIWLEKTRIQFSITMNGQSLRFDAVTKMDGQPVSAGQNISLGSHTLSVSHPKADAFSTNFSVWYGGQDLGELKLNRSKGTLNVQASPPATTIIISGPEFSLTLHDSAGKSLLVPTDQYVVEAQYPHWSQSQNSTVINGRVSPCVFSPRFGALHLTCNHDGATYGLQQAEGQNVESGNLPVTVDGLPAGSYQLTVSYHNRQLQKSVVVEAGVTNEVPLKFALGAAKLESVPAAANVNAADGRYLGQTPLDISDVPPQTAQFNLSLQGYEPVSVTLEILADQTAVGRTNLLSVRHGQALQEARQYLNARNYEGMLQAANEALALKPDDAEARALQATATEGLGAARQRADAERQQANAEQQRLDQLKRPRAVFAALCDKNPDAALFSEHEMKSSNPAKNVEFAIVQALQAAPMGYQITSDGLQQTETYQVTASQTFSLGILGGTERICLLVVGQTKEGETQILFKVLEYQIQHTAVVGGLLNIQDNKQLIPMHPSRMQMNDINQQHVQDGVRIVTERIQKAVGIY
jgi:hypothetical protein